MKKIILKLPRLKKRSGKLYGVLKIFLGILLVGIIALSAVYFYNVKINQNFKTTFYQVSSGKVKDELRIIQLSDFHNSLFGNDNTELINRIEELKPDLVVMTGDMIDEDGENTQIVLDLCKELVKNVPVYYVYGNHETLHSFDSNDMSIDEIDQILRTTEENRSSDGFWKMEDELKTSLEELGVKVLWNETDTITIGRNTIDIYGVLTGNPYAFWQFAEETFVDFRYKDQENFKLMLCHEPYIFETWKDDAWADLSLAGHTHGGAVRLPRIGALYEHKHGIFPEFGDKKLKNYYIYGKYNVQGYPLIVSGGLSQKDLIRINNQPELVVIDVNRY